MKHRCGSTSCLLLCCLSSWAAHIFSKGYIPSFVFKKLLYTVKCLSQVHALVSCIIRHYSPQGSAHLPKHSFQTPRPQTRSGKASSGSAASSPWTPASYCCEEPVGTQTSLPVLFSKAFYLNKRLSTEKPVGVFSSPLSSKQLGKEKRREKRDGLQQP